MYIIIKSIIWEATIKGKQKKLIKFISIGLLLSIFMSCSLFTSKAKVSLSITDAPIVDGEAVEGVYITITGIEYNLNDQWISDTNFTEPKLFNLLELTNGEVAPLSDLIIDSGTVSQIRFLLDVEAEDVTSKKINPGCYIIIDSDGIADGIIDETDVKYPLFVPSGTQSGFKLTSSFTVPSNGEVEITADFDVRKSVVKKGVKDEYLLKPTIRLVVNNQAGSIEGDFIEPSSPTYDSYVIFAYNPGDYSSDEISSGSDTSSSFSNSVSSTKIIEETSLEIEDHYILPYLANGEYDLIVVGVDSEGVYTLLDDTSYKNVTVQSGEITDYDINLNPPI